MNLPSILKNRVCLVCLIFTFLGMPNEARCQFVITKVVSQKGINLSPELVSNICVGKAVRYGSANWHMGQAEMHMATYYDCLPDFNVIRGNNDANYYRFIIMNYRDVPLHWLPYRNSSTYFSPNHTALICSFKLNKGVFDYKSSGEMTLDLGRGRELVLKVKSGDTTGLKCLDIADILPKDEYIFDMKILETQGKVLGHNHTIYLCKKENNDQFYLCGYYKGSTGFYDSETYAFFNKPVPINSPGSVEIEATKYVRTKAIRIVLSFDIPKQLDPVYIPYGIVPTSVLRE